MTQSISIKNHVIKMVECGISPEELNKMPCTFKKWPIGLANRLKNSNIIRSDKKDSRNGYTWNRGDMYPSFMKYYKENKRELNKILKKNKRNKK
jgi:hypothetical protein